VAGLEFVVLLILLALFFDFWNGVNDAANSIATVVSTRVLSPRTAVAWAAWWNFAAAFGFGVSVATTIGKGIVQVDIVDRYVILAALVGAIAWVVICTESGIPVSVSHSLIGGLIGGGLAKGGLDSIIWPGVYKVLMFILLSPVLGFLLGLLAMAFVLKLAANSAPTRADRFFRRFQLLSSALYSLGHGTNDAQKTMGIIAVLLFSEGYLGEQFYVPIWVILSAHAAIAMGTLAGGWRVVRTMGMRLTKLRPVHGFCAETAGGAVLNWTASAGIPVSTTHTITGSIIGVGATIRLSAVRWGVARRIVWAWLLTIPATALLASASYSAVGLVR